eukprot:scaffold250091_cov49-Prasinocladus_malaysianus.AAC.2
MDRMNESIMLCMTAVHCSIDSSNERRQSNGISDDASPVPRLLVVTIIIYSRLAAVMVLGKT